MPYPVHLAVSTAKANLSKFTRYLQGSYTVRGNRRAGHVSPEPFKSLLIETEEYPVQLIRKHGVLTELTNFNLSYHRLLGFHPVKVIIGTKIMALSALN
jgi:hypothetical protein